ncbi:hypothetical protein [Neobacillus niacini]|uniref:hypothetical protein n=1 Tax=Neobacillus niacini TaxID=86668 RepID=UPI0021CAE787|nr:hypothetical protein [Neobacillus niacini]MCM3766069.1 hypothetical protein [Neobacillus niacini]
MNDPKQMNKNSNNKSDQKSKEIKKLEKEVALGLWIQVVGQLIELKGLTGIFQLEEDTNRVGEQQILTGVWIRTIGQLLEALSVSRQINETDLIKILQEQKIAITGDLLVSIGSAYEVVGGINVLEEESVMPPIIVP